MTRVLIIGAGGVGAVVMVSLKTRGLAEVSAVVRRDYNTVKDKGYEIHSFEYGLLENWKPDNIYSSVEEAGKTGVFDFVVVTTKNLPDISKVEDIIAPVVTHKVTSIVLIQNGFDIGRPIIARYPHNVCLSGVTFVGSHNHNGVVRQTQPERTQISYFPNSNLSIEVQKQAALKFVNLYSTEKNQVIYSDDSKYSRYRKLVYNGTLNPICTLVGTDTGRLELSGGNDTVVIPAMKEIIAVARADGVDIPDSTINDMLHDDDGDYFTPSMAVDAAKGNVLEIEVILGNLVRVARELKVATPVLDVFYSLAKIVQFRMLEKNGYVSVPKERPIDKSIVWK